jgi:hypothetical protein
MVVDGVRFNRRLIVIEREHGAKTHLLKTQVHATWAAEQTHNWNLAFRHQTIFLRGYD